MASNQVARRIFICNRTAGASGVTLWFVPANTVIADDHRVIEDMDLADGQTVILSSEEVKLGASEEIYIACRAAGTMAITVMD
jgi:hypothetical protein